MEYDINAIKVGKRHRKDMGDLQSLADSIAELGQLQPIGITVDGLLVYGERRLKAIRDILGRDTILVRMLDISKTLEKERAENEIRKDFTPSERVAIAQALEAELKAKERRGRDNPVNVPEYKGQESRQIAAGKAGFSSESNYRQAKTVVQKGTPELVEAMDNNVVSISQAAKLAKEPEEDQRQAVADPMYLEQIKQRAEAEMEAAKTHDVRVDEVVNSFEMIANSKLSPGELLAAVYPKEREIMMACFPRVREFMATFEGAGHVIKAV